MSWTDDDFLVLDHDLQVRSVHSTFNDANACRETFWLYMVALGSQYRSHWPDDVAARRWEIRAKRDGLL